MDSFPQCASYVPTGEWDSLPCDVLQVISNTSECVRKLPRILRGRVHVLCRFSFLKTLGAG